MDDDGIDDDDMGWTVTFIRFSESGRGSRASTLIHALYALKFHTLPRAVRRTSTGYEPTSNITTAFEVQSQCPRQSNFASTIAVQLPVLSDPGVPGENCARATPTRTEMARQTRGHLEQNY